MDWLGEDAWAVWLAAAAVLGAAELLGFDLILIMLAVGALAGALTSLAGLPFVVCALVAAGASAALLGLVRPSIVKRLHSGPDLVLGSSRLVGRRGTALTAISGVAPGRVRVDGEEWTAAPYDEHLRIEADETVEVLQIRGATAYVHPVAGLEG